MASTQIGPRGVGMVEINNPRMEAKLQKRMLHQSLIRR